jgi:transposase-like protein
MTQRKQTKRRFSPEFKLEAVEQVVKHQQRAVDVARALDVDATLLRPRIREWHQQNRGTAGSRMQSQLMCREGYKVGRWFARRLTQECGLESRSCRTGLLLCHSDQGSQYRSKNTGSYCGAMG